MAYIDGNGRCFVVPGPLGRSGSEHRIAFESTRAAASLFEPGPLGSRSRNPNVSAGGGATVWAFRTGSWSRAPGWGYVIGFYSLADLIGKLEAQHLRGKVSQLGIVAHGDLAGRIELDRDLTVESLPQFYADLGMLTQYLVPDAWVTFYSCIAGKAKEGSELLTSISKHLRGRTIVGFELYGFIGIGTNAAGMVKASETQYASVAVDPKQHATQGYLSPWCPYAKRAWDGQIVHLPLLEQNNRAGFACANPSCPGHSSVGHSCPGW